jgi:hypothetical protein
MGKMLLGLVVGIALTTAVFVFVGSKSDEVSTGAELASPPVRDGATQTLIESSERERALNETEALRESLEQIASLKTQAQEAVPTLSEAQLRNLTADELDEMTKATAGGPQYGRFLGEGLRRERVERWGNAPPPDQPINLPPEFSWLDDNFDPFHEQLQRESVDPDWSYVTEAQIAAFLGEHPEITQKYGQPTVTCRTSGCQLSFVAYGVDESTLEIMGLATGQSVLHSIIEYPWADQFATPTNTLFNSHTDGNVTTILWHLVRKPEEEN